MVANSQQKWDQALEAFLQLVNPANQSSWLLSIIDQPGTRKTEFLTFISNEHCRTFPSALFSLESYTTDLGGLLSIMIESDPIRPLLNEKAYQAYVTESKNALIDLSRKPLSFANQDVHAYPGGTISGGAISQNSKIDQDAAEQVAEVVQQYSEIYSEMRMAEAWLNALGTIRLPNNRPLVLLFDDYYAFEGESNSQVRNLFWNTLSRAHRLVRGLRVMVASQKELRIPKGWKSWGGAKATYL